ncbi:MAG: Ycf66 family protein, partial [Cyanobacteriota bacterium]|nr:Ycf66 family protein [Cyanobacteriota bacterium]
MVNASLNWGSIVGIVLAVGGALLYFMRSVKPALARDYDVFFAAIGLLCGGVFFFQGWRLDPILQFGVFLLAGTTMFFAYESVRLRGVAVEGARRSS